LNDAFAGLRRLAPAQRTFIASSLGQPCFSGRCTTRPSSSSST
jgi:hypothetical protein